MPSHVRQNNGCKNEDPRLERNSASNFKGCWKKEPTENYMEYQRREFAGEVKNFCVAEGTERKYAISETKDDFADSKIRSLMNFMWLYMEDHGYKYTQKLPYFVGISGSRINCTVGIQKEIKNLILSLNFTSNLKVFKQPKFNIGDKIQISKIDWSSRKCYIEHCTEKSVLNRCCC